MMTDDLSRWQGRTESQQNENSRRLDAINGSIDRIEESQKAVAVEVATIRTKVAFWSAIGGLGGSGLVALVVGLVAR